MAPDLESYDWIVVNSSAGKDSQAMLDVIVQQAKAAGVLNRVVVVHADLGRVEWKGTRDLAAQQAAFYKVRFEVVSRVHKQGDLITQIRQRGMFPDNKNRYCTSDQKRGQVDTLFTKLANETRGDRLWRNLPRWDRKVRILNCLGLRADESPARAKKTVLDVAGRSSNGKRQVDHWLPIHDKTVAWVWETIHASKCPFHYAYALGLPRVSCVFCIFSPRSALLLSGKHNPELLNEYVQLEKEINHTLRVDQSLQEIQSALASGEEPGRVSNWVM